MRFAIVKARKGIKIKLFTLGMKFVAGAKTNCFKMISKNLLKNFAKLLKKTLDSLQKKVTENISIDSDEFFC